MVPLLHACLVENPRVCGFRQAVHAVREEREVGLQMFTNIVCYNFFPFLKVVDRDESHYQCVLRDGKYFLVNSLAFSGILSRLLFEIPNKCSLISVPIGSKFSAVQSLM